MNSTAFFNWWANIGSGMAPLPGEDQEEHARRVSGLAWKHCAALFSGERLTELSGYSIPPEKITPLAWELAARAWSRPETSSIEVDIRLAAAFGSILTEVLSKPWLGNATNRDILAELAARIPLDYSTVASFGQQTDRMAPSPAEAIAKAIAAREKNTRADSTGDR